MTIKRLDAGQADAAAATLGESFFDDPLMLIVAPDEATRRRWGPWFMSLVLQYGLRWGEVWGTDDSSAVAVWVPPDSGEMGLGRMLKVGLARMPFRLGDGGTRRFMQSLSATEPFHKTVTRPALVSRRGRHAFRASGSGAGVGPRGGRYLPCGRGRGAVLPRDRDAIEHRLLREARVRRSWARRSSTVTRSPAWSASQGASRLPAPPANPGAQWTLRHAQICRPGVDRDGSCRIAARFRNELRSLASVAERTVPTPEDRGTAVQIALSGVADETDLDEQRTQVEPLNLRNNTLLGEVLLELAADAIEVSGASRERPIEFEKIRERHLPECTAHTKAQHHKSIYALRTAAMIRAGVDPGLLDEVSWWRTDDLWFWALDALVVYLRVAAERTGEPINVVCERVTSRHDVAMTEL